METLSSHTATFCLTLLRRRAPVLLLPGGVPAGERGRGRTEPSPGARCRTSGLSRQHPCSVTKPSPCGKGQSHRLLGHVFLVSNDWVDGRCRHTVRDTAQPNLEAVRLCLLAQQACICPPKNYNSQTCRSGVEANLCSRGGDPSLEAAVCGPPVRPLDTGPPVLCAPAWRGPGHACVVYEQEMQVQSLGWRRICQVL